MSDSYIYHSEMILFTSCYSETSMTCSDHISDNSLK